MLGEEPLSSESRHDLCRRHLRLCRPTSRRSLSTSARKTLHFFPDRVLIHDSNGAGAVSYQWLQVLVSPTRFVEDGGVPRDATEVDRTWRYANKKGGRDRRFKDNREIPVCQYEEVALRSDTGLNELLQISRLGVAATFVSALASLGRLMPTEISSGTASS